MDILEKLGRIARFLISSRGAGHTRTLVGGLWESTVRPIVIVRDTKNAIPLFRRWIPIEKIALLPINEVHLLQGIHKPMVIDNDALMTLCTEAAEEIQEQRSQLKEMDNVNATNRLLRQRAEDAEQQLAAVQARLDVFNRYIHVNCTSDEGGWFAFFTPKGTADEHEHFEQRVNGCESEEEAIRELSGLGANALKALREIRDYKPSEDNEQHF